jgi:uncharacterized protein
MMTQPAFRPLLISCAGLQLVGTVHVPQSVPLHTGVVFVTGGMQTRAGSHRAFMSMARVMAARGVAVLRFDLPGLGDSEGDLRSFDANGDCLRAAIDSLLSEVAGVEQVLLWGLCDGASAAALYAGTDKRVAALFLVNPWVHTEQVHAQAMVSGYYRQRILSADFWRKLLSGKVGIWRGLREYFLNLRRAREASGASGETLPERLLHALHTFEGNKQILIAGQDMTGQAFLQASSGGERLPMTVVDDADHTFSSAAARAFLTEASLGAIEALG